MKLANVDNPVLTNSNKESKFTINASAQAFRILSDGLYQYKIAAIVRELSFNASDSHRQAGKQDIPFHIIFPNELHPYFEIEDFGVGLDDDEVREVYTSYFTSTKAHSNEAVGAFGLGSKTPFAYTNTFTIRARKDGVERVYTAYIGSDGAPCVNMLFDKPTKECNGVKITIPVKEKDFFEFYNEGDFVLSFFSVRPTSNREIQYNIKAEDVEKLYSNGYVTVKNINVSSNCYSRHSAFAVMGGVCYPIPQHLIERNWDCIIDRYSSRSRTFIAFDIGDLQVAASRETLSLDEKTEEIVKEKLMLKLKELLAVDQDIINNFDHPIKAIKYAKENYAIIRQFEFRGTSLDTHELKNIIVPYGNTSEFFIYRRYGSKIERRNLISLGTVLGYSKVVGLYREAGEKTTYNVRAARAISNRDTLVLYFSDPMTQHKMDRVAKYLGVDIEWQNLVEYVDAHIRTPKAKAAKRQTVKRSDTEVYAKRFVYKPVDITYSTDTDWHDTVETPMSITFWGERHSETYYDCFIGKDNKRLWDSSISIMVETMFPGKTVYVLAKNKKNQKRIEVQPIRNIVDVFDEYMTSQMPKLINSCVRQQLMTSEGQLCNRTGGKHYANSYSEFGMDEYADKVEEIRKEIESYDVIKYHRHSSDIVREIENQAASKITDISNRLDYIHSIVLSKYPLLEAAYDSCVDISKIITYIKQVDTFNSLHTEEA